MSGLNSKLDSAAHMQRTNECVVTPRHNIISPLGRSIESPSREYDIDPNATPIPGFSIYSPNL